jgi:hypothetical protein
MKGNLLGLDAAVFKNISNVEKAFGGGDFDVDGETGEVTPKRDRAAEIPWENFTACSRRLGNIAAIGELRRCLAVRERAAADGSRPRFPILQRFVVSGSHSGDVIRYDEIAALKQELADLRDEPDEHMREFLLAISELTEAAEREHNPIVFV